MSTAPNFTAFNDFDAFWTERSPFMLELIKSQFVSFLLQQRHIQWTPVELTASLPVAQPTPPLAQAAPPVTQPAPVQTASVTLGRDQIFPDVVAVYAKAMEYPPEVFTETVELEAELGIDSVKQTEILGRISETYRLPRLPANVRISDFKTMGQIVDLVFANQGKGALAA